jgi:predicted dehydrogenase
LITIIVIGTGNIGRRHIQAISKLHIDYKLYCNDSNEKAIIACSDFIKMNSLRIPQIFYSTRLLELSEFVKDSIVILATTANNRISLFEFLLPKRPLAIIAEKPLCQSQLEYDNILKICENGKTKVYVNFIAHLQPFYHEIKSVLKQESEFIFYSNLPRWGISTVGIHHFELLTWLFDIKNYKIMFSHVKEIYEQKRESFYDLAGSIHLMDDNGNIAVINNTSSESIVSIQIITQNILYNIFQQHQKMLEIDKGGTFNVKKINYIQISEYMHNVIMDIINDNRSKLPTVDESIIAHRILFDFLNIHNLNTLNIT